MKKYDKEDIQYAILLLFVIVAIIGLVLFSPSDKNERYLLYTDFAKQNAELLYKINELEKQVDDIKIELEKVQ